MRGVPICKDTETQRSNNVPKVNSRARILTQMLMDQGVLGEHKFSGKQGLLTSIEGEAGDSRKRKVRQVEARSGCVSSLSLCCPGQGRGLGRGEGTGTLLQALCLRGEERGPWEEATGRWDGR